MKRFFVRAGFVAACGVLQGSAARAADVSIVSGPMIGHTSEDSARVWMQLPIAGEVSVTVYDIQARVGVSGVKVGLEGPSPFVCDVPVNNLQPDHLYRIDAQFEGKPLVQPPPEVVFRTAPRVGDEIAFSMAFGSGLYFPPAVPNAALRPGGAPIFTAIADLKPRVFLFLGDTGFLPTKLEDFPTTRRAAYRLICDMHERVRRDPDLQELFRTTACYGIYSDRDFGPRDVDKTYVFANESLIAFQHFWPNPDWGTPASPGCFATFTFGDVDVFMLDARTFRDPPAVAGDGAGGAATAPAAAAMLGAAQIQWLEKNLQASRATFKLLAAPCTLFGDDPAHPDADSWSRYPTEQQAFLRWMAEQHISGMVALAGNQAAGQLTKFEAGGVGYPLFSVGVSTLNNVPAAIAGREAPRLNPLRQGGVLETNNFGTLDFGGEREHRFVTLRVRDDTGKTRLEQTLFSLQLRRN
jgi:alkaline phosphatase D